MLLFSFSAMRWTQGVKCLSGEGILNLNDWPPHHLTTLTARSLKQVRVMHSQIYEIIKVRHICDQRKVRGKIFKYTVKYTKTHILTRKANISCFLNISHNEEINRELTDSYNPLISLSIHPSISNSAVPTHSAELTSFWVPLSVSPSLRLSPPFTLSSCTPPTGVIYRSVCF